ncbi:MAG TPA: bifunctional phosphoribosylaminoimidazolecarboxamide formyltransferase/IMP cyclohydrolase [Thermomicrobiales bacterium]|nr:bifunctional phosphoribosylaminoimidazolecarboxamide formyltransferase/IMP cyclohydrolase [Thermomicrobiales bacterium]
MRALISVYDKSDLEAFASGLVEMGWSLISTGGTLSFLREVGLPVTGVDAITGFPEILDGRVKTLHPAIHGGILARRMHPDDLATLQEHGLELIDMVVGNLYPFAATISRPNVTMAEALENVDIGGPAMIRAAAKNFPDVLVITEPTNYKDVLAQLRSGEDSLEFRQSLAAKAFAHIATYDALIASYLGVESRELPDRLPIAADKAIDLRYGENPHQRAAAYRRVSPCLPVHGVLDATQLQGKELSYNNVLDADAALALCRRVDGPACVIVKHAIPCGAAVRESSVEAFSSALAGDPVSAFGGIVAINREVDRATAECMSEIFFEVILAPAFSEEARTILGKKKNLRLLTLDSKDWAVQNYQSVRSIAGGFLVQDADVADDNNEWKLTTTIEPTVEQRADLAFAWEVVRSVRSNAIVLVRDLAVVGVGPGQPNRLDCVKIALARAGDKGPGSVMASDAFFPFADGVQAGIEGGVVAIVQPGGSLRDAEVIGACDTASVGMYFTGTRHFLH